MSGEGLTERQKKWFASVRAGLERDTGRSMEEWVAIARTCPETTSRARTDWLRKRHGLGVNRAYQVVAEAFPSSEPGWGEPEALRAQLWTDPASAAILEAVERATASLPDVVAGQRKGYTAFSRRVQFAAVKPLKGGAALLGLRLALEASPALKPAGKESWSERLKSTLRLEASAQVDAEVERLLRAAWEAA